MASGSGCVLPSFAERVGDVGFLGVGTLNRLLPSKSRGGFHDYGCEISDTCLDSILRPEKLRTATVEGRTFEAIQTIQTTNNAKL